MEILIKEAYETLREIVKDVSDVVRSLSKWKTKKLLETYKQGISAINSLTMRVIAEVETAQRVGKRLELTSEDRENIVMDIITLSSELNEVIESDAARSFLGSHPGLGDKVYLKMYGEREDYLPQDIYSDHEEFITWINIVHHYINEILKELDKTMSESLI